MITPVPLHELLTGFVFLFYFDPPGYNILHKVNPISLIFYYLIISALYSYLNYKHNLYNEDRYSLHNPETEAALASE